MQAKTAKKTAAAAIAAALIVLLALVLPSSIDNTASDAVYNRPQATDGEVIVIGMDQRAIDELGPMPWPRTVMADVINYLNQDPDNMPAAIGLDVLYVGRTTDENDAALAEACELGGNVVAASAATFGSQIVGEGRDAYLDSRAVLAWDQPYDDMLNAVRIGQINAMPDTDSIVRHALYRINVPGIGEVKSFSRVLYEKWCDYHGIEPNPEPETTADFFYLAYSALPGSYYEDISVVDLLNGEVDPDYFAGKIVLIGPYTMGMQDEYRTSIAHALPMYGIEIQANEIDAFKRADYPKELSKAVQLVILFIVSFIAAWLFIESPVKKSILIWVVICLAWAAICLISERMRIVLHVLWIPLAVSVLFVASVAYNYARTQREKRRISSVFGRYVDPAIIKELLDGGQAAETLGGKNCDIAVLFVDIRGFTSMSESLPPATVVEIINKYLTLTTECIMRYHGTLDKFVGDCTMAFWNAPVEQDDPIFLACCAAMDMVEGAKTLAVELQERFGRSVGFGVGVHFGPAVVGNIGAPQRMDFTAIGDTVNTASRLESNAPAGTVYISRVVADALGNRAKTTSLGGTIKLKGKAEGFEILTLDELNY